ncbi:related to RAD2-structure-specific nuclease of the nucleotide excision repairosome [Sporisorium reilianum f. sp. reilianum]|uniref:Related to RAD2-structure-specific nuclease of the nucleotide excision repairosome n=1 Tax=Sporisorium reilianum f. sp. reilianum TaxID=72559 RepID=A0A2N8UHF8_9BASI|nr:related to RAD2-structure-specific nuclease of the nucleotide excision repairosome [Sporisorium reilianum f. sp. reilianum]
MGVQGLWQLLQPVARPIKIETLEGKRLAIDSSLWLYHFQMAMRDKEGRTLSNAHILGFLWRILKLLFHGVRPVFVFDGGAPVMKRKTLSGRKARRQGAKESHARTAEKLLAAQMRQAAIKHVADGQAQPSSSTAGQASTSEDAAGLGENTVYFDDLQAGRPRALASRDLQSPGQTSSAAPSRENSSSPSKPGARKIDWHKDPYALPAMEKDLHQVAAANGRKGRRKDYRFATEDELRAVMNTIAPEDLDTTSDLFRSLPAELQYELVGDLRAQSRMTSYKRLQSMLATAPTPIDFSRAQIAGLKTRNDLTQKVLTVTDEIGKANIKVPIRVAGERNKEYVLVRNPGAEGGFVLGVRDAGTTQDKAIDVDHEPEEINITDDEAQRTDSDPEMEMDDVEIPVQASPSRSADPELDQLQSEADPHIRKEKALELLQARAKFHAKQKRREAGVDDDDEELERAQQPRRKHAQRPLFIRNQRSSIAGTSDPPQQTTEWIDVDADSDDDDFQLMQNADDELEKDEAEDLARAIAESQASGEQSVPSRGLKLAHRSGEPISLHDAMANRQQSTPSMSGQSAEPQAQDDLDLNEDDFEDVSPEAPSTLREVQPVVDSAPTVDTAGETGDKPDRMQELAALVGRGKRSDGHAARPPPPRKSLAGSLRAARRSTSNTNVNEQPEAMPSPEVAPSKSEEAATPAAAVASETPPRLSVANAHRMGPPLRSASQQRLELAAMRPKSVTPATAAAIAPPPLQEDLPPTPEEVNRQIDAGIEADKVDDDDDDDEMVVPPASESKSEAALETQAAPIETSKKAASPVPLESAGKLLVSSEATKLVDEAGAATSDLREPEEPGVPVSLAVPEEMLDGAQGPGVHGADPDAVAMDNVPSAAAEHVSAPTPIETPADEGIDNATSRQQTPIEWSPTPSPEPEAVVIGADGFPLPTAEELDALDAEDEDEIARLNADQNEFVAFLSATKGRSLLDVQKEVESEVNALRAEFANSRRSEEDITKQMAQEIQMMLRLFGLPYITAPMEAEAQCAELVSRRLVDGIITDDSDVFLFGATRIYKNMFNNNKIVECFLLSDMQRELGLDREKLVRLAYYLGSDYTDGLAGVGPVVAMELLALFPGEDGLLKFREWWLRVQMGQDTEEHTRGKTMRHIKKNLRNKVHLEPSWPEPAVLDAYYAPTVDESDEPFAWGLPDLDSLRTFLGEYLHWPVTKTDQYLLPIIERQNARNRARGNQTTLDRNGFFDNSAGTGVYAGRKKVTYGSNRLQEVINGFRAANKRGKDGKAAATRPAASGSGSGSSDDDDEVQVVGARMQTPVVSEEMLGKEMAKRRPIVRRDDEVANKGDAQTQEARRAELDAAIAALEGPAGGAAAPKRKKKPAKKPKSRATGGAANDEDLLSSSASSSSGTEAEVVPAKSARTTRGGGRGRGRTAATTRGSTRGRGRGARANLHAARNMSLDDIDSLPPSRSPSVDPATLRARGSRRSSSASSTTTTR